MARKIFLMAIIWALVALAYVIMAAIMPALSDLTATANASLEASANMSNFPGTREVVNSFPLWGWFIPGLVGVVTSVITLVRKD